MRCLGHHISNNGSIAADFHSTTTAMWNALYANLHAGLSTAPLSAKVRFLESCVRSSGSYHWSRWPFQPTYAKRIDSLQTHMIAVLENHQPRDHEDTDDFFRRRSLSAGRVAARVGRWSHRWANSIVSWSQHLIRQHDLHAFSSRIYKYRGSAWLELQRQSFNYFRTGTRVTHEKVCARWQDTVEPAKDIPIVPFRTGLG